MSGGGVYVSDKPGEHDVALLRQLVLPDGSVLRCSRPGRPTRDCLFKDVLRDGVSALKVQSVNTSTSGRPAAGNGATAKGNNGTSSSSSSHSEAPVLSGVVGAFHLQGSSWDRDKRKFYVHNPKPAHLDVQVGQRCLEGVVCMPPRVWGACVTCGVLPPAVRACLRCGPATWRGCAPPRPWPGGRRRPPPPPRRSSSSLPRTCTGGLRRRCACWAGRRPWTCAWPRPRQRWSASRPCTRCAHQAGAAVA